MGSLGRCLSSYSSRSRRLLWAPILVGLALPLTSCGGTSGPSVILVPALVATRTQVRTAEGFRVKVLITLPDGTVTISKRRVQFPPGSWITLVSEKEMAE